MLLISNRVEAQRQNSAYLNYIEKYKDIAIHQMKQYGIPASITLAQGLLESGAGSSDIAVNGNNHFGIKCGGSWTGETITHFDDGRYECFRKYHNVEESFKDHSIFLQKERYKELFSLAHDDYKGWAKGLKRCGYATSPTYAERLIKLVEQYELYRFDSSKSHHTKTVVTPAPMSSIVNVTQTNVVTVYPNGIPYIIIRGGETLESVSNKYGISERKIRRYNDLPKHPQLHAGDIVYLASKKNKASKQFKRNEWHRIKKGESMYSISQCYGIKLKKLYKMNFKDPRTYTPRPGDLLKIR